MNGKSAVPIRFSALNRLYESKVVAIVRAEKSGNFEKVLAALAEGGITIIEVSLTTPGALCVIEEMAVKFGKDILLGAGTVLDPESARLAINAGAQFVFAPSLRRETIEMCRRYSVIVIPGALTPTEILSAWEWGADMVKVFPAGDLGPCYAKTIKAPLPQVDLVAVGGVSPENARDFIKGGYSAVGIGSSLVKKEYLEGIRLDDLKKEARALTESLKSL